MRLPLLLLALAALLAWGPLPLQVLRDPSLEVVAATHASASAQRPPSPPQHLSSAASISPAPPLFRAAQQIVQAPQPGDHLILVGLAGPADRRVAYLRDDVDGRTFTARVGEAVRNWMLEEANERCVVLRRARRRENVCLS